MIFKQFTVRIILRTILVMFSLTSLILSLLHSGYHALSLLSFFIVIAQLVEMTRFVSKTNTELTRFLDAARYADFSQHFEFKNAGSGFEALNETFTHILTRLQTTRATQEQDIKHLKAVVEHVPVPLISIHANNKITLWNNSARRLFGSHSVVSIDDFAIFGDMFTLSLQKIQAGQKQLLHIEIDGMQHQLSVSATQIIIAQKKEILISMQDIQNELDTAQLQAWQDLVRVLTHEIMNSITPVASLAKTATDLVDDVKIKTEKLVDPHSEIQEELNNITDAVSTVARRSESLMHFVTSYRRLTSLPEPQTKTSSIEPIFEQTLLLAQQSAFNRDTEISLKVTPKSLTVDVDKSMLEQVLLNLLLNASHAIQGEIHPKVTMSARLNKRGHVVIEVSDNGIGVEEPLKSKIFVPFYTTKREGSGVGLALTRQVMIAHGGSVTVKNNNMGGATFSLTF